MYWLDLLTSFISFTHLQDHLDLWPNSLSIYCMLPFDKNSVHAILKLGNNLGIETSVKHNVK